MSTKYWQYIKERNNESVIETGLGFAVYRMIDAETVYLVDMWVQPEHRRTNVATELMCAVAEKAKQIGATKMLCSCVPSANGSTNSLMAILAMGFKVHSSQNDIIYLIKEL